MYRDELKYSDYELINLVYKRYGIKVTKMNYVNIGSFYAFIIDAEDNKKLFLKIYPKDKDAFLNHWGWKVCLSTSGDQC